MNGEASGHDGLSIFSGQQKIFLWQAVNICLSGSFNWFKQKMTLVQEYSQVQSLIPYPCWDKSSWILAYNFHVFILTCGDNRPQSWDDGCTQSHHGSWEALRSAPAVCCICILYFPPENLMRLILLYYQYSHLYTVICVANVCVILSFSVKSFEPTNGKTLEKWILRFSFYFIFSWIWCIILLDWMVFLGKSMLPLIKYLLFLGQYARCIHLGSYFFTNYVSQWKYGLRVFFSQVHKSVPKNALGKE